MDESRSQFGAVAYVCMREERACVVIDRLLPADSSVGGHLQRARGVSKHPQLRFSGVNVTAAVITAPGLTLMGWLCL